MAKPKILIVEDNVPFVKSLDFALKPYFDVDVASDLKTALQKLNTNTYNIVSTDGAFPEEAGQSIGHHGILHDEDYRGNILAKEAHRKGLYVIGLTQEPERLTEPDLVLKKPVNVLDYIKTLKENLKP